MKRFDLKSFAPRRFLADEGGSISIEFVIVMPLLLFLVTGGLAYWDAFHSNTQTARVAFAINDIMGRHDVVDNTDMAYLYNLEQKMLPPDLDQITLRITSICFEGGAHTVLWSYRQYAEGAADPGALQDQDVPVEILPDMKPQDSVILTEVTARWQPHFANVGIGEQRWRSALVTRPRFVKMIPHTDLNGSNICPVPANPAPVMNGNNGVGNGEDPQPPGDPQVNDGPGTSPGSPGAQGGVNN